MDTPGRGRDQHRAEAEELVGLHDDRVARAALLVPSRPLRRGQAADVAANHSVDRRWRELGELFANDPHLLAIALICGKALEIERRAVEGLGILVQPGVRQVAEDHQLAPGEPLLSGSAKRVEQTRSRARR